MIARLFFVLTVLSVLCLIAGKAFSGKGGVARAILFVREASKVVAAVAFAAFVLYLLSQLDNLL